jgi:hypothetical protein
MVFALHHAVNRQYQAGSVTRLGRSTCQCLARHSSQVGNDTIRRKPHVLELVWMGEASITLLGSLTLMSSPRVECLRLPEMQR